MLVPGKRVGTLIRGWIAGDALSQEAILNELLGCGALSFQRRINTGDQAIFFERLVQIAHRPAVKHSLLHSLV